MASTSTTRLQLFKPTPGTAEPFRASDFNDNMDKIDAEAVAADSRLDAIEALNTTQNGRLDAVEGVNTTQNSRLTTVEAWNAGSRLTTLEGQNLNTRLTTAEGEIDALQVSAVSTVSGTTRALLAGDAGNFIRFTSADDVTFTINDTISAGQYVNCVQDGAGKVSFVAGSGVTLQSPSGATVRTPVQYAWASVIKIAAGEYRIVGQLEVIA